MALAFGMPEGISDELEATLAAIQTWAGKQDGNGKWVDIPFDANLFKPDTGTWTVKVSDVLLFKYMVVGRTMTVAFHLARSVAATINVMYLSVPAPYQPVVLANAWPTLHGIPICFSNACGIWRDADDYTPGVVGVVNSRTDRVVLAAQKLPRQTVLDQMPDPTLPNSQDPNGPNAGGLGMTGSSTAPAPSPTLPDPGAQNKAAMPSPTTQDANLLNKQQQTTAHQGAPPPPGADPAKWNQIVSALTSARSTDDPNYWYGVISRDPNGFGSAWDYWQGRINNGDGIPGGPVGPGEGGGVQSTGSIGAGSQASMPAQQDPAMMGAFRDALMKMMATDQQAPSISDPSLAPQANAFKVATTQGAADTRAAMAERMAAEGLNSGGAGSGAFDTGVQGINEQAGQQIASKNADLVGNEVNARRAQLMQALDLANSVGARTEAQQIQLQLANMQNQYQYKALDQQQGQFADSTAFNYAQMKADMDRQAALAAMNG